MTCVLNTENLRKNLSQLTTEMNTEECENLETKGKRDALSSRIMTDLWVIPRYDIV